MSVRSSVSLPGSAGQGEIRGVGEDVLQVWRDVKVLEGGGGKIPLVGVFLCIGGVRRSVSGGSSTERGRKPG